MSSCDLLLVESIKKQVNLPDVGRQIKTNKNMFVLFKIKNHLQTKI